MNFHPLRNIRNIPGLSVFEGIFTLKNLSFPHVVLGITSLLFQTPNAPPVFVFTSLPVLINLAASRSPGHFLLSSAAILIPSLTLGGLFTSWGLVPNAGQVILGQSTLSGGIGVGVVLAVLLHRWVIRLGALPAGDCITTLVFGLIWASAMLLMSSLSPFGRFELPSPSPADISFLAPVFRHFGPTGVDVLTGPAAYAIAHTGEALWKRRDTIQEGPLPTFHDTPRTSQRSSAGRSQGHETGSQVTDSSPDNSRSSRHSSQTGITESTLGTSNTYTPLGSVGCDSSSTAPTSPPSSRKRSPFSSSAIGLAGIGALLTTANGVFEPAISTTSDSLAIQTPFGLGFVLPPSKGPWRLGDLVHEAKTIGNRANLLVFPESAYHADGGIWDRQWAIDKIVREVCQQYGVWVQLGIDTPMEYYPQEGIKTQESNFTTTLVSGKKVNEVVLMGPEGLIGSYVKQSLIPYVESFPLHKGLVSVPTWRINLPPPPGLNKTTWATHAPYTRPIHISPLICLDTFHPDLLASLDQPPDLFTVSASALTTKIARHIIKQAESVALTHSAPVMVVAGSPGRMDQGISAITDSWGRPLMQQRGGRSSIYQVSLAYHKEGETRGSHAKLGSWGVLGAGIVVISGSSAKRRADASKRTDHFPMRVFRYLRGTVYAGAGEARGADGGDADPATPPPRYSRIGGGRHSTETSSDSQWLGRSQGDENEWA